MVLVEKRQKMFLKKIKENFVNDQFTMIKTQILRNMKCNKRRRCLEKQRPGLWSPAFERKKKHGKELRQKPPPGYLIK